MPRKPVPQNMEAEKAVLGCLAIDCDSEDLTEDLFFSPKNLIAFRALVHLRGEGMKVDVVTLGHELEKRGQLEEIGGLAYLVEILESVPHAAHLDYYVRILREMRFQRNAIEFLETRLKAAKAGDIESAIEGTGLTFDTKQSGNRDACSAVILRMSDVRPEPIRWLWPSRIARGKLSLISGDPGLGKSLLTIDMAARVSRGSNWPDGTPIDGAGGAVIISAEDDPSDTIRPRLDAAGADVSRITMLAGVMQSIGQGKRRVERSFRLEDLPALASAIDQCAGCRLVIVDPVTAYLGSNDSHKNGEIRGLLAPISELAQRTGVAIVAVTHLNKSHGGPAIYRTMGSLAFTAAARSVWTVTKLPDDPKGETRLLLPVKNNIGNDRTGLAYDIKSSPSGQPVLLWDDAPIDLSADDVLSPPNESDGNGRPSPQLDHAVEWLKDALRHGPRTPLDLFKSASGDGITKATLRRAKDKIGIQPVKDGFNGGWVWSLPDEESTDEIEF